MKKKSILNLFLTFNTIFGINLNKPIKSSVSTSKVPDIYKRQLMNRILLNSVYASCGTLLVGYLDFFAPPSSNQGSDGLIATDRNGDEILSNKWISEHPYPGRDLVQGIKGDPYYLITTQDKKLEKFALNAVCTHLGCVVPWNVDENKFMCPCHGSQYDSNGKVVRGPAPLSLKMASVDTKEDKVILKNWEDEDFRTNQKPWWN